MSMPDSGHGLPRWRSLLVVVAHPDDESFGLGAVISTFIDSGTTVTVLCFTRGGASTLHGVAGDLATIRADELADAAHELGVDFVRLLSYPDAALTDVDLAELADHVADLVHEVGAEGLLVFDSDGVTGHPDHVRATTAATAAAGRLGLGVLGWTIPHDVAASLASEFGASFTGHSRSDVDLVIDVDRRRQLDAVACHPSQAVPGSVLWRRLDLLGSHEHLRWLGRPLTAYDNEMSASSR